MQTIAASNAKTASEDTPHVPVFRPPSETSAIARSAASSDSCEKLAVALPRRGYLSEQDDLRRCAARELISSHRDADGFQRKVWPERQFVGDRTRDRKQLRLCRGARGPPEQSA